MGARVCHIFQNTSASDSYGSNVPSPLLAKHAYITMYDVHVIDVRIIVILIVGGLSGGQASDVGGRERIRLES